MSIIKKLINMVLRNQLQNLSVIWYWKEILSLVLDRKKTVLSIIKFYIVCPQLQKYWNTEG